MADEEDLYGDATTLSVEAEPAQEDATTYEPEMGLSAEADMAPEADVESLSPEAPSVLEAEAKLPEVSVASVMAAASAVETASVPETDAELEELEAAEPATPTDADDVASAVGAILEEDQAERDETPPVEDTGRDILAGQTITEDGPAIDRLLSETNSKLASTENSRRRTAIAHLKAAVAARKADDEAGSGLGTQDGGDLDRYREDLAKAVRPRRPVVRSRLSERASPLVLVSEQRVDNPLPERKEGTTVRPRRVVRSEPAQQTVSEAIDQENVFREPQSFTEFARDVGASDLTDLMEAAAAYTSFIEGERSFSRPQIMRQISLYDTEQAFSREDGLRSFGLLLRQGKIQRLSRGEYAVTKTTRFNPEARNAG